MTVSDLIEELKQYPQDMLIVVYTGGGCMGYSAGCTTEKITARRYPPTDDLYSGDYDDCEEDDPQGEKVVALW